MGIKTRYHQMMTRPVKKMVNGGDPWGTNIMSAINGTQYQAPPIAKATIPTSMSPITAAPISSNNSPNIPLPNATPAPPSFLSSLPGNIKEAGTSIAPYASNIINSFRTPPQPAAPHLDSMVTLRSPSFGNERNSAERNINADTEVAARNVDGNTGARIRMYGLSQKLDRLSEINQRDSNTRLQTQNDQSRINAGVEARNNEKLDSYSNQQVERRIAEQQQQSSNFANLSDKVTSIQNEREKRDVDLQKTRTLSTLFSKSGVGSRERQILRDMGVPDPTGKNYDDLEKKATGGQMGGIRMDHSRGFYRNLAVRGQTIKSLYKAPN